MTISDQGKLLAIVKANQAVYMATDAVIKRLFAKEYAAQTKRIEDMKKLSTDQLADEFRKIQYVKDSLFSFLNPVPAQNTKLKGNFKDVEIQAIKPPQMTLYQNQGDCDDFSFLASAVTGGQIFCFLESIANQNSAGHFVCIDRFNNIWSKARKNDPGFDGKHRDIQETAGRYVKKFQLIVNLNPKTFTYTVMERK
jgi:hypothetical protein